MLHRTSGRCWEVCMLEERKVLWQKYGGGRHNRSWGPRLNQSPPKHKNKFCQIYVRCLKTTLGKELPKLYPTDNDKVSVHHDKASSHTATFTQGYAEDLEARRGTKIIKNTLIPVKSPDISPMDFFGFGHLKQKMFSKRKTTMDGFWKLLNAEWWKITPEMCQGVFLAWKKRCRTVAQVHGEHIEQIKDIHNHRI